MLCGLRFTIKITSRSSMLLLIPPYSLLCPLLSPFTFSVNPLKCLGFIRGSLLREYQIILFQMSVNLPKRKNRKRIKTMGFTVPTQPEWSTPKAKKWKRYNTTLHLIQKIFKILITLSRLRLKQPSKKGSFERKIWRKRKEREEIYMMVWKSSVRNRRMKLSN